MAADMTFKANLIPNTSLGYSLGSSTQKWNVYGNLIGNADTATGVLDAGDTTKTLTIRYHGPGADATDWIPMQDSSGNLVPVSSVNLANKVREKASGTWGISITGNAAKLSNTPNNTTTFLRGDNTWTNRLNGSIHLYGQTYGNTASDMKSGTAGVFQWGDKGPQITFDYTETPGGGQAGALIYTDNDAAGAGVSWHFVSNQGDWNVNSKRFVAKTSITIGQNLPNTSYNFYVNGTSCLNGNLYMPATSGIYTIGNKATYRVIRFIDNTGDTYGNGIAIGCGGGPTIIGGGESADAAANAIGTVGSEVMYICNDGAIEFYPNLQNGWTTSYRNWIDTSGYYHGIRVYGAVWNDYAEFRETKEDFEPGRCIREVGDDTLVLSTERLQPGCEIISDTYGFAIGESDKCKTPTATSGRVLAYSYEDRELLRNHIGEPVCSGPNGTVSLMTHEEEKEWPSRIIGTISAIPDYEIWNAGYEEKSSIKVNGRIWIRIR